MIIQSCVGGGPMERLAFRLEEIGREVAVGCRYGADDWRERMSAGRGERVRTRLGSLLAFPISAVLSAAGARHSIVVPTTNPFFLPGLLVGTRWLHRSPVVALVYDLWPEAAEVAGAVRSDAALARMARAFNRWWLHRADLVVFIGPNMQRSVTETYGAVARSAVIETGADLAEFLQPGTDRGATDLDRWLDDGVVAAYVGNLGAMHDVETMADAVDQFFAGSDARTLKVLIAASGPGVAMLRARWEELSPDQVRFEDPLDDDAWRRTLLASDIALVTLREEAVNTSLPSKTFSAMAAGCAILAVAPTGSDLRDAVERSDGGVVVSPGDDEHMRLALERFEVDAAYLADCQVQSRETAARRYDMRSLAARWDDELARLEDPDAG